VRASEPGPALLLDDGRRLSGSHLLVATGKRPDLDALALEAGRVRTGRAGIATDRGLRSITNHRVFAVGDVADPERTGPRAFAHVGTYHAGVVIRRAVFRLPARIDYRALPRVTYTNPELAQVGLTEAEARTSGRPVTVLRWPLAENDRAQTERDPSGLVKLVVSDGRLVGVGILAAGAGEMITAWALAITRRVKLSALSGLIVPYPTQSEAVLRALQSFYAPRLFSERTKAVARWMARLP